MDRILQNPPHNIKDTNVDTPLRQSFFAKILPDMAEERQIVPLTPEQEMKEIREQVKKQDETLKSFKQAGEDREKMREELKKELLEELKAEFVSAKESVSEEPSLYVSPKKKGKVA